jgi:ATP-dependent Lon protease
MLSVEVGRRSSLRLLEDVVKQTPSRLLVATQKDPGVEEPGAGELHEMVVEAEVLKVVRLAPERVTVMLQGIVRRVPEVLHSEPYLVARVLPVEELPGDPAEVEALALSLRESLQQLGNLVPQVAREISRLSSEPRTPGQLADAVAAHLDIQTVERITLLSELDVRARLGSVLTQLQRSIEVIKLKERIGQQVRDDMSRQQREAVLRQQMKVIREELGETDGDDELDGFDERIAAAGMGEEVEKVARRQLERLRTMNAASPEYSIQRTYLEWLCDLPWSKRTEDRLDLEAARAVLDADHYGIQKVKKRILEYLAVRKLAPGKKGPILCLAGPPGVGKTSLGKSIAKALGREFVRMSLGGVRDEAEVRGHRRTYVGALPGRIVQAVKRAGTKNPVLLLDEIDKLGADYRGDPSSALLEVLDPEQNSTFSDHYLEVPFDLSEVIFIATANALDTIPAPLLDRMELIQLPGYTLNEKRHIAFGHLLPKQLTEHGVSAEVVQIGPAAIDEIIEHYTREAGVRNLERELANVIRSAAMRFAAGEVTTVEVRPAELDEYLGPARFFSDVAEQTEQPGVATGLAWTPVGGDILFIEATLMPGSGHLMLTGQLGAVMKESAQAALSWVRAHSTELGLAPGFFEHIDVHVHVPQGGIPKDGPSAGCALVSAIVSLVSGRRVRSDVAMTGEITLRGAVLPVGGIKEKVLAAHRAGIKRIVLPERNGKDLVDVPEEVRNDIQFILARRVETVLENVLEQRHLGLGQAAAGAAFEQPAVPALPVTTMEVAFGVE